MHRFEAARVFSTFLVLGLGLWHLSEARDLTSANRAELANVPREWKSARICFHEGGGIGGSRVVIGIEERGPDGRTFVLRPERPGEYLPGYLMNRSSNLADKQMRVAPSPGAGYTDGYAEIFVMPNGIRMTCEDLPQE